MRQGPVERARFAALSQMPTYLMKRISEYFGSGQRSSGTMRSSRSATSRTAAIAGMTVSGRTSRRRAAPGPPGGRGWRSRARRCARRTRRRAPWTPRRAFADADLLQRAEPADRGGQQHRAGDRRRRLALDVDRGDVLLDRRPRSASRARARRARRSVPKTSTVLGSISQGRASGLCLRFASPRCSASACHSSE